MSTHVFHRSLKSDMPVAVRGEGALIFDASGKSYIDASGGAAVSCLGHDNAAVRQAIHDQVDGMAYAHTGFFTTEPAEKLADFLVDRAPGNMDAVYFLSGGSEAVEAALKMARQYFLEIGEKSRTTFIAREQSYHGNTLGALGVSGNVWRREPFDSLLVDPGRVSPCYPYRDQEDGESDADYVGRLIQELEDEVQRLGPENVIAFVAETVGGATQGALAPLPGYLKGVREVCDRHGMLLILDEVMCGMGRTGTLFAYEQEGIVPDIVTIAKGLGGGYQPIGATLVSDKIYGAFKQGSGSFQHGHTYMGHPTACAAALAVQNEIERMDLLPNVRARGEQLTKALHNKFGNHLNVGDIRGRGLFQAIELVADRGSKQPFDPSLKVNAHIKKNAMKHGLICYPMGGTINGQDGDHVLLAPPFIADEALIDEIVERLGKAVDDTLEAL